VTVQNRIFFTYLYLDNTTGMTHLKIQMPLQPSFFLYVRVSFVTYGFFNDGVSD